MNVVLLTVDALRPDHLSCYGYGRPTSPNVDELAERSVVFENAFSAAPGTKVAFKPLFTGLYPGEFDSILGIPSDGEPTLAETFSKQGFETGGFHTNGFLSEEFNYDRGFEEFLGPETWPMERQSVAEIKDRIRPLVRNYPLLYETTSKIYDKWMASNISPDEDPRTYRTAEEVNEVVFDWLDGTDDDFFLWVHYMDVHEPYIHREEYVEEVAGTPLTDEEFRRARSPSKVINGDREPSDEELENVFTLYDSEIRYVDEKIGQLVERVQKKGKTMIVFTADHGESFGEVEGKVHKQMPYWNMVSVPLIIDAPEVSQTRIESPVSHVDLPGTALNQVGIEVPENFRDINILSDSDDSEPIFIEYLDESEIEARSGYAYITDGWKYVRRAGTGEEELIDLRRPPKKRTDVSDNHPDVVEEMSEQAENYRGMGSEGSCNTDFEQISSSVQQNLRELGYLDR